MNKIVEITEIFTSDGIKKLKVGQILIFEKRVFDDVKEENYSKNEQRSAPTGSSHIEKTELKITKITKIGKKRIFAKKVTTYTEDEIAVMEDQKLNNLARGK